MADGNSAGMVVKIALSVVAIAAFIIPEAASSIAGLGGLFAIWGIDWEN